MNKFQVVAAIIKNDNKFLLGKRSLTKKIGLGCWSPISGRIKPGESEPQAVCREVFEEVGLKVHPVKKVAEFDTHDKKAKIHWWLVDIIEGEPFLNNDEHSELRWLTVEEMEGLSHIFSEDIELFRTLLL